MKFVGSLCITVLVLCVLACGSTSTAPPMATTAPMVVEIVTRAPTPAPTRAPTPGPSVGQYRVEVKRIGLRAADTLEELGTLLGARPPFGEDPDETMEWAWDIMEKADTIQALHEELMVVDVPPEMAEFHEALLDAHTDLSMAADCAVSAIGNPDPTVDLFMFRKLLGRYVEKLGSALEMSQ